MRHVLSGIAMLSLGLMFNLTGCKARVDAIAVSQDQLLIDYSTFPQTLQVWNTNPSLDPLAMNVSSSASWIVAEPLQVSSNAPQGLVFDKRLVTITIDRHQLTEGVHEGYIEFLSPKAFPKRVNIRVKQDYDGTQESLRIVNPHYDYSSPYLVDFSFSLRDDKDRAIVAEPAQLTVTAFEGAQPLDDIAETGVHLRRGAARQLKVDLVLDYTISMQQYAGAISSMEDAATNVLLPALNEDTLVGVWEFHRDDADAGRVAEFTVDRPYLVDRITSIQQTFVNGFYSASKVWEAMADSIEGFGNGPLVQEARYLILFSDGRDTSSAGVTKEDIVNAAMDREIHLYTIGLGAQVNEADMVYLAEATGGRFFPAASVDQLAEAFEQIIQDLGGQYVLRWATLRRTDAQKFRPAFSIALQSDSATYTAPEYFVPSQHKGDVTQGLLRLVASENGDESTVFLRADYMPRFIHALRFYVKSPFDFTVTTVDAADDGLVDGWDLTVTHDGATGGKWVALESSGANIPFATFGPLIKFTFAEPNPELLPLFTEIWSDNSLYPAGQSFDIEGYDNPGW